MTLRELREEHDYRQKDIAEVLHCKQNTYQQYESGKRQIPWESLKKLCLFYGVSADYLLELPKGLPYPDR